VGSDNRTDGTLLATAHGSGSTLAESDDHGESHHGQATAVRLPVGSLDSRPGRSRGGSSGSPDHGRCRFVRRRSPVRVGFTLYVVSDTTRNEGAPVERDDARRWPNSKERYQRLGVAPVARSGRPPPTGRDRVRTVPSVTVSAIGRRRITTVNSTPWMIVHWPSGKRARVVCQGHGDGSTSCVEDEVASTRTASYECSWPVTLSYRRSYVSAHLYDTVEETTTEDERGRRGSSSSDCSRWPVAVVGE
jgi:hypothetical protein